MSTTSTERRTSSEIVTLRFCNHFQLFKVILLEKCVLTILELNWNQRLGHKKTKLNICHHMLTSSTRLQNRSFHVVERTRTSTKCQKMKSARAKRAKILSFIVKCEKCTCEACKNTVFHCKICKFVGFLLPSSSWLLKLPNEGFSASLLE